MELIPKISSIIDSYVITCKKETLLKEELDKDKYIDHLVFTDHLKLQSLVVNVDTQFSPDPLRQEDLSLLLEIWQKHARWRNPEKNLISTIFCTQHEWEEIFEILYPGIIKERETELQRKREQTIRERILKERKSESSQEKILKLEQFERKEWTQETVDLYAKKRRKQFKQKGLVTEWAEETLHPYDNKELSELKISGKLNSIVFAYFIISNNREGSIHARSLILKNTSIQLDDHIGNVFTEFVIKTDRNDFSKQEMRVLFNVVYDHADLESNDTLMFIYTGKELRDLCEERLKF